MSIPFASPSDFIASVTAPENAQAPAWWFMVQGAQLLVHFEGESFGVPRHHRIEHSGLAPLRSQYLGSLSGAPCYAAEIGPDTQSPAGSSWQGLRALYGRIDDALFALAGRAVQIVDFERTHQFCGRCAAPMIAKPNERARQCSSCAHTVYPRIAPAVMALVLRGRELLLARSPHFVAGMYSALAGFVEPGESLEECLRREVREEVGVTVENLRYFNSQPWPFPHSLMIAFLADYAGGELQPDPAEIEDAGWYRIDALPLLPGKISIARRLIDHAVAEIRSR